MQKPNLKRLKKPGTWRTLINRTRADFGYVQTAVVLYLGFKEGLSFWWLLIIPAYLIFKIFDIRDYHKQEAMYNYEKNPYAMEMLKKIREIHRGMK